ncbi:unnamed protein product [Citrullus colocynthis]|uniref:Uncharacterized protein n=1 Tax=Citrullus colocynthis TaxID=252529 RepID=A0ABP0ZE34_9ROSI
MHLGVPLSQNMSPPQQLVVELSLPSQTRSSCGVQSVVRDGHSFGRIYRLTIGNPFLVAINMLIRFGVVFGKILVRLRFEYSRESSCCQANLRVIVKAILVGGSIWEILKLKGLDCFVDLSLSNNVACFSSMSVVSSSTTLSRPAPAQKACLASFSCY